MAKKPRNLRNLWLIKELCAYKALYNCRETFTDVMSPLQIRLFMQNEPNFRKSQMNVNKVLTKDYEKKSNWTLGKNEPKRTQFQCSIMLICAICSANTSTGKFRESADTLSYYDRENTLAKYCEMAMIMPNVAYTTFRPKGNRNSRSKCAYEFETIKFGGKPL